MKSIAKVILSAFLSVAPSLQNQILAEPETANTAEVKQTAQAEIKPVSLEISPIQIKPIEQKLIYEIPVTTKYSLILNECKRANAESLTRTRKISGNLEKSIAKYGFESVAEVKNKLDKECLDLIVKKLNNEISEQDIEKEKERLAIEYQERLKKTNISAPVNFISKKMINAQKEKINIDIRFYEHLMKTNLRINPETKIDYNSLVTAGFSQQEYEKIISQQLDALNRVYDSMQDSRTGFRGLFASGEINAIRREREKQLTEEAKKNYTTPSEEINKKIKEQAGR